MTVDWIRLPVINNNVRVEGNHVWHCICLYKYIRACVLLKQSLFIGHKSFVETEDEDGQFDHVQNVWLNELQSSFLLIVSGINVQSLFFSYSLWEWHKRYILFSFSFFFSSQWSSLVVVRERKREREEKVPCKNIC
jgi:hypothetical protein